MEVGNLVLHTTDRNWGIGIVTKVYSNGYDLPYAVYDTRRVVVYWYKWEKNTSIGIGHLGVLCK